MRKTGAVLALVGAGLALVLALTVFLGQAYDWRAGPIRVRVSDPVRPLVAAAVAAALALRWPWSRRQAIALLAACGVLALVAYARTADPAYAPAGDIALIESYTIHAADGQLFVGPYSRFEWHHPGPLYFLVQAPFYAMSGHRTAGLSAGALAINLAALAALALVILRGARPALAMVVTTACALFMWRAAPMLASQWNPHVLPVPAMTLLVLAAAVAAGDLVLLPILAAVGTFIVQTHLGLLPMVAAVGIAGAIFGVAARWRDAASGPRSVRRVLNATLWILTLLWLLPVAEELYEREGNLFELWTFFTADDTSGQSFRVSFRVWADHLSALVRNEVGVPWGTPLRVDGAPWIQAIAIVQTAAVTAVGARAALTRDQFLAVFSGVIVLASAVALWSVTHVDGEIFDHLVFWIAGLGAIQVGIITYAIAGLVLPAWERVGSRVAPAVLVGVFLAVSAAGFVQLRLVVDRSFRPALEPLAARRLADAITPAFRDGRIGKPLVTIDHPIWGVTAGVLLQLQKERIQFAVEDAWTFMFGRSLRPTGNETHTLIFAGPGLRLRLLDMPGYTLLAERDRVSILVAPLQAAALRQ